MSFVIIRHPEPGEPTPAQKESGDYRKRRVPWAGLTISVENEAGTFRRGRSASGHEWATLLPWAYGYVNRTEGVDGDEVDVYLGPYLALATNVYVVHQRRYGDWDTYDEDKAMLGFDSEASARDAFLACYDDPRFLGPITSMPVADFVAKVKATKGAPAMLKSSTVVLFLKAHVGAYVRAGRPVLGYENHRTGHAPADPRQGDLFAAPVPATAPPAVTQTPPPAAAPTTGVQFDAHGRDPDGYAECPACHHPHKSEHCPNPGCDANPQVPEEVKARRAEERERNAASEAERQRIRDIQRRMSEPQKTQKHYATIVRGAGTPGQKVGYLAGPFDTHEEAKGHVARAREAAEKVDPFTHFDAFGTAMREAHHHPPGRLNEHLGIK